MGALELARAVAAERAALVRRSRAADRVSAAEAALSSGSSSSGSTGALCAGALCVAAGVLATFRRSVPDVAPARQFVEYDDPVNFVNNPHIHGFTSENLSWIWRDGVVLGVWEPAALLFKLCVGSATGHTAGGCLLASLLLHVANCVLGFCLCCAAAAPAAAGHTPSAGRGLSPSSLWVGCCALASLAFGAHPLRVEVVEWASAQPYLLAALAALAANAAHRRGALDHLAPPVGDSGAGTGGGSSCGAPALWRLARSNCRPERQFL